jgi:hypothetical protein
VNNSCKCEGTLKDDVRDAGDERSQSCRWLQMVGGLHTLLNFREASET